MQGAAKARAITQAAIKLGDTGAKHIGILIDYVCLINV